MVIEQQTIANRLEDYIRKLSIIPNDDTEFTHDVNLFEYGYVDSVGATEVLDFIHKEYGVSIPDELLFTERATTISGMASIIERLK